MDQETREFLEERFRETSQKIDGLREELREEMSQGMGGLREEMSQKLDGLREEMREGDRLTRVVVEGLRSDVRLVAEGLFGMNEKMTAHEAEVQKSLDDLKALFIPPYQGLDSRVKSLDSRVSVLEERAHRQTRDVLEVLREKFGKRQSL